MSDCGHMWFTTHSEPSGFARRHFQVCTRCGDKRDVVSVSAPQSATPNDGGQPPGGK